MIDIYGVIRENLEAKKVQFAPYVRVNCVAPGWVNTEMNKELPEERVER